MSEVKRTALAKFMQAVAAIRATGGGVDETSYYGALEALFNDAGKTLKPNVFCVLTLANRGEGSPDAGFYTEEQREKKKGHEPRKGQKPSRGAMEVKPPKREIEEIAGSEQVARYLKSYGQVLVTNLRDWRLLRRRENGGPVMLEGYRLAATEKEFWEAAERPVRTEEQHGTRFIEYLRRVMLHAAPLDAPEDVAFFLASYARDALARIEAVEDLAALSAVRAALEEALGLKFEGKKGEHFFRSSLIQTLFYGGFSAWVIWARQRPPLSKEKFDWRLTSHLLRVPVLGALFHQVSDPRRLGELGLDEVMDWTAGVLTRVDRPNFFRRFQEEHAVQYFYEPFLEEFDPELRKQLGVWYTPPEIVEYMVARVDTVLREELGCANGLADKQVYVLDPCCGTGSYLVEVLRKIHATLKERRGDALVASDLKEAAKNRVFGFEILPAPFVVAHLQLGLLLQSMGAPLSERESERVGVYLTNALTGWEPPKGPKQHLMFRELEEERDAAEKVKQETPILVILGNPPYNGFAGVGVTEERELTTAYRTTKKAAAPQGQGLNDLYVRFYRMAERRIVEKTGKGIVSFISNYSWLDGLSFTGMRERYLEVFDRVWVDCLNGDKYKTGKLTPEGKSDPSIFSTEWNPEGIQVGTAIGLLVRKEKHSEVQSVSFRHFWGKGKRQELHQFAQSADRAARTELVPALEIGLPLMPMAVEKAYASWPLLPDLFPTSFPGVKTSRDDLVVDIDRERLIKRMQSYFDPNVSHEEMARICASALETTQRFSAKDVREKLRKRGFLPENIVKFCYRPFDDVWLYWEPETKLLDEKRDDLFRIFRAGNVFLTSRQKGERHIEGTPFYLTRSFPDWHLTRPGSMCIPLHTDGFPVPKQIDLAVQEEPSGSRRFNCSMAVCSYLEGFGFGGSAQSNAVWNHVLAIGYSPAYLCENADGIRQDWPRIPLPASKELLEASAALGEQVAALLDTEAAVEGVTSREIREELRWLGVVRRAGGKDLKFEIGDLKGKDGKAIQDAKFQMRESKSRSLAALGMTAEAARAAGVGALEDRALQESDLAVKVGWGHAGKGGVTMPGKGKLAERDYTVAEREAIAAGAKALGLMKNEAFEKLGGRTCDVYLNDVAYWGNVPVRVWEYRIGGYQVIKKWLSYREEKLLGRALTKEEVRYVQEMVRRIAAICLLQPALDANYRAVKQNTYDWQGARETATAGARRE